MAKKENNCTCVVCQVEQSLLDSLSTQIARTHFQALAANHPVLNHFDSPTDVIARLHDHERVETDNHNAWNGILHALVESLANGTTEDIGQQLLLAAYTPAIHKTCNDICSRFPALCPEDVAQQASLLFLQTARWPMMLRQNGHLQLALIRNFRKEMLRWALRESRSASIVQDGGGELVPEPLAEDTAEPTVVLDKVLRQALREGLLSEADYKLLLQFKCEGFAAKELALEKAGSKTANAMHHRLKKMVWRLRKLASASQQPDAKEPVLTDPENFFKNTRPISPGACPFSNSEGDFSPELSHEPQSESDITQVAA